MDVNRVCEHQLQLVNKYKHLENNRQGAEFLTPKLWRPNPGGGGPGNRWKFQGEEHLDNFVFSQIIVKIFTIQASE